MSHSARARKSSVLAIALTTALVLALPLSGVAIAAPPAGAFLNPDADGPGTIVSAVNDGTNSTYHFVLSLTDAEGLGTVSSVAIQIEDGDADATFETIGTATRVGTTDVWELFWSMGAHTPSADVDNDPGFVRALASDSGGENAFVPDATGVAVVFGGATTQDTVEITFPENGGDLGFFGGSATLRGTGSAAVNANGEVEVFYTKTAAGSDPAWIDCDTAGDAAVTAGSPNTWTAECVLQGGDTPAQVTGVAARADDGGATEGGNESGDAHRVSAYEQVATGSTVAITPGSASQSVGFCSAQTLVVNDSQGNPIVGASVDVHATGPDDALQFASNAAAEGTAADPFAAPDAGTHSSEPAAACDGAGEPDGAADDKDSDATGTQGDHDDVGGNDTKHIEGTTGPNGFRFSLDSAVNGTSAITGWFDSVEDDVLSSESSGTASVSWGAVTVTTVTASPASDTNITGDLHTVTGTVKDANGNPIANQTLHFRVASGANAGRDLDANGSTPNGYFGSCLTGANGQCAQSYTGVDAGTDTIEVWVNIGDNDFAPDADDVKATVTKDWVPGSGVGAVCIDVDPNTVNRATTATQQFTAFVTDGTFDAAGDAADAAGEVHNDCSGNPVNGVGVTFTATDTPDARLIPDANGTENDELTVTSSGMATITIDNKTDATGSNDVTANVEGTTTEAGDTDGTVTWLTGGTATAIECTPANSVNVHNGTRSLTATVTDALGDPVANVNVDFVIAVGPNADRDVDGNAGTPVGYIGEGATNSAGQVTVSYTGVADSPAVNGNNDLVNCFVDANDDDVDNGEAIEADGPDADGNQTQDEQVDGGELSDFIDALWRTTAGLEGADVELDLDPAGANSAPGASNSQTCDGDLSSGAFGGATWEPASSDPVNGVRLVCVSARDANAVLDGASVTLTSSGAGALVNSTGGNPEGTKTAAIANDGYARFWIHSTDADAQTLTASVSGVTDTDAGTETWTVAFGEHRIIDCTPANTSTPPGSNQEIVCLVHDGLGNGVPGVDVTWTKSDSGGASSAFVGTPAPTTDANGIVRGTVTSNTNGETEVTGTFSGGECTAAAGEPHTASNPPGAGGSFDTNKPAGDCADTSSVTWGLPTVTLDQDVYDFRDLVEITVVDGAQNTDPGAAESVTVRVVSSKDTTGIQVTLFEDGNDSSTFRELVILGARPSDASIGKIQVVEKGTLTVRYDTSGDTAAVISDSATVAEVFTDDTGNTHEQNINSIYAGFLTGGCGGTRYCPTRTMSRGEMATFIANALGLPPATQDYFDDDNGTTHEANINKIREAGITGGCGSRKFCPSDPVTRAELATFIKNARNVLGVPLPTTSTDFFNDDNGTTHEANINRVAAAGIAGGCAANRYCPNDSVRRDAMATFMAKTFFTP